MPKLSDLIEQFVEDLDLDTVRAWAKLLNVQIGSPACDDDWLEWEDGLRVDLVEAMERIK